MRTKLLWMVVPAIAALLAIAAAGFGLGLWSLAATSDAGAGVPVWHTGDSWTYNVTLGSGDGDTAPTWSPFGLHGQVTETVAGTVSTPFGTAYNVTLAGTFGIEDHEGLLEPQNATVAGASLGGYAWYRTSDLATVQTVRTVHVNHTFEVFGGTDAFSYDAMTSVAFNPPIELWKFPLQANETWNVTSNATVEHASTVVFESPNATFSDHRNATFTIRLAFDAHTGLFENVTTPAGTFNALPTRYARAPFANLTQDDRISDPVVGFAEDCLRFEPRAFGSSWFSAAVGNVVRAHMGIGELGLGVSMVLVAYHVA